MSHRQPSRILVIGYGNPGRRDDGLGPAFAGRLEALRLPGVTVESDYQLVIEHAHVAAQHDVVVFADAAADIQGQGPFYLRSLEPAPEGGYSSHSISPQAAASFWARRQRRRLLEKRWAWRCRIRRSRLRASRSGPTWPCEARGPHPR